MLHSNQPDIKSLIIREAHSGDIPVLDRLSKRFEKTHEERLLRQQEHDAVYLVALLHGHHIGHALLLWDGVKEKEVRDATPNCPTIEDVYVDTVYRSRGIGTRLIEECVKRVRERGLHKVGLSVGVKNVKAKQLYMRLGFLDSGISDYYVQWPYLDKETGEKKVEGEMCRFLIKHL